MSDIKNNNVITRYFPGITAVIYAAVLVWGSTDGMALWLQALLVIVVLTGVYFQLDYEFDEGHFSDE